jgi:hypothetical protein
MHGFRQTSPGARAANLRLGDGLTPVVHAVTEKVLGDALIVAEKP